MKKMDLQEEVKKDTSKMSNGLTNKVVNICLASSIGLVVLGVIIHYISKMIF